MGSNNVRPKVRYKCPQCSNFLNARELNNGTVVGVCPVCKCHISSKRSNEKTTIIKIISA